MAAARNNDKPLGNIKRVNISDELNQDPAQYPLANGKLVTFPDIFDMPTEQAEEFLDQMNAAGREGKISPVLKKWLSPEDYKALDAEYPTMRKIKPVFYAVMNYYQGVWGDQGEDPASEGS